MHGLDRLANGSVTRRTMSPFFDDRTYDRSVEKTGSKRCICHACMHATLHVSFLLLHLGDEWFNIDMLFSVFDGVNVLYELK